MVEAEASVAVEQVVDGEQKGNDMKYRDFIKQLDDEAITEAVKKAELQTAGEICVCISKRRTDDPMALALKLFNKFKMHETEARNGVILLIAPRSQATAIYGDEGIHKVAGQGLWEDVIKILNKEIPEDPTMAIVDAVKRVGSELSNHFPRQDDDKDELTNEVRFD